ncbi:hypothetical protein [Nostoc sp.]|uniref:hypothetical protein n=1 Tax=Nostoc sp. TaxID=1180 RepID=UPI002FFC4B39
MFEKSKLIPVPAIRNRTPVAHGGNPQDRTGLATRDFTHRPGLKILDFLLVHGGRRKFV